MKYVVKQSHFASGTRWTKAGETFIRLFKGDPDYPFVGNRSTRFETEQMMVFKAAKDSTIHVYDLRMYSWYLKPISPNTIWEQLNVL